MNEHAFNRAPRPERGSTQSLFATGTELDAVALVRRAALALDRYHAHHGVHGALCLEAIAVGALGEVTILPPTAVPNADVRAYWSPQRHASEPPRTSDDLYAFGMIAIHILRATRSAPPATHDPHRPGLAQVRAAVETLTAWSPAERPASGAEFVRTLDAVSRSSRGSSSIQTSAGATEIRATEPPWAAASRVAQARRAHQLAQTTPPRPVRPPRPRQVRAPLGKGHYPDMPLPTGWVAALVMVLCSVYLLPLYFMLFPSS